MQEFPKEIQLLMRARQDRVEAFYRAYDPSRLWQECEAIERKSERLLNGEGRHFKSYRIPSHGQGLDLALNVAKPAFALGRPGFIRQWMKACEGLKKCTHPLLPPFEILEGMNDQVLLVMPYCEDALTPAEHKSPSVTAQLGELSRLLAEEGLILDDYWQLRRCQGLPFVIDFSELKMIDTKKKPATKGPGLSSHLSLNPRFR